MEQTIKQQADALLDKAKDIYKADSKKLEASILAVEYAIDLIWTMDQEYEVIVKQEEQFKILNELKSRI